MRSFIVCAGLLLGLTFQSCSKEESLSKEEKLTSGLWKFHSYSTTDPSITMDSCNFDNTILFYESGGGVRDEGIVVCSGSEQYSQLYWSFGESSDILMIYDRWGIPSPTTLSSLSESKLVFEQELPYSSGTITIVFKH